jgi:glycosyltransferase involved in cell wall biosynthesis
MMRIGIFDHLSNRLGGGQSVVAHLAAELSRLGRVDLIHGGSGYTVESLSSAFGVDLTQVTERIFPDAPHSFAVPGPESLFRFFVHRLRLDHALTAPYDLFVYSGHGVPPFSFARRGVVYCHFPFESDPGHMLRGTRGWEQRSWLGRRLRSAVYQLIWNRRMQGYHAVLGNSRFTAEWIERRWETTATVLYPPVTLKTPNVDKGDVIVSLGRFVASAGKNHDAQLRMFKNFCAFTDDKWALQLIGFCAPISEDRAYVEKLRRFAQGLPVELVVNADRETVARHLARAKVFWHTTGLGEEADVQPECMEHFGIATVEAMGAGCIPIVPMCGGQPEIVEHGRSGFLCRTADDYLRYSKCLMEDQGLQKQMSGEAEKQAQNFRLGAFERNLALIFDTLMQLDDPIKPASPDSGLAAGAGVRS